MGLKFGWLAIEDPNWLNSVFHELNGTMEEPNQMPGQISLRVPQFSDPHALFHCLSCDQELVDSHGGVTSDNLACEQIELDGFNSFRCFLLDKRHEFMDAHDL